MAEDDSTRALEPDAIEGVPLPRETYDLVGHGTAERTLLEAYRSERLHHAWLVGGPHGIGKATLAFRFARFVLAHPDRRSAAAAAARDLAVPPDHPVSRKVAAGAHPDILHLRRPYDDRRKRFKQDLSVDEVRRTVSFFGSTAAGGNWRICIVDAADDMNQNAANALLKVLEEPPPRSLFLVLAHAPGRLLPTIRSRCRRLSLSPLGPDELKAGLETVLQAPVPPEDLEQVLTIADGSLRRALRLMTGDGLDLARRITAMLERLPDLDVEALHALADVTSATAADDAWALLFDRIDAFLHQRVRAERHVPAARLVRWSEVWEKTSRAAAEAEALNLDRKQVVLSVFRDLAEASRSMLPER